MPRTVWPKNLGWSGRLVWPLSLVRRAALAIILLAAACAPLEERAQRAADGCALRCAPCPKCPGAAQPARAAARYEKTDFAALPGWSSSVAAPALRAFLIGCERVGRSGALGSACARAQGIASGDEVEDRVRRFFETAFDPYAVVAGDGADSGLITGYYEPILPGRRAHSQAYRVPVFGVPQDMIVVDLSAVHPDLKHRRLRGRIAGRTLVPYYSRAEIERRNTQFEAPVLAWVADPVALFFLQIQGSGQIAFEDGTRLRLGYADQNGHPYRSLGRALVERGELQLEDASMQGIQAWAAANPEKLRAALDVNPSYVFFRVLPEAPPRQGPIGALGVPLTAEASLAVDRRFIPLGAPVYLATTHPLSSTPLEQLMVAQDTGGAIRGAVRADLFWGTGPAAGTKAGRMRQQGRLWLLWPRGVSLPQR